jgi:predicted nucleic-acid-binding protein
LESLVGLSYLEIQDKQIFEQALMLYKENSVSLVDCFLLASAVQEQRDIMTFDKKLQTLARKELI